MVWLCALRDMKSDEVSYFLTKSPTSFQWDKSEFGEENVRDCARTDGTNDFFGWRG